MTYDKVRCWLDVVLVEIGISHSKLEGHDNRIAGFVKLRTEGVGRELTVEQAIAWHRTVSSLLASEQEIHNVTRCLEVAVEQEASPRLVEVAREDLAIRAEEGVVGVSCRDCLAPW